MTIEDYANETGKTVQEILYYCEKLNIAAFSADDEIYEDSIIELDIYISNDDNNTDDDVLEDTFKEAIVKSKVDLQSSTKQKIKKKNKETTVDLTIEKKNLYKNKNKLQKNKNKEDSNLVLYTKGMSVNELSDALNVSTGDIIKKLMQLGVMLNVNSPIDFDTASIIVSDYKKELKLEETQDVSNFESFEINDNEEDLETRPPVITIMGHVDHGKTTLLDTIRKTSIAEGEAGGITQHIGAYQIKHNGKKLTFIDTPGHAAFTKMRARGAAITDIVIIIVAADDGVMPQTKEAIDHAKAAKVPIIVAVNKIDKPNINKDRILSEMADNGLTPESWGGDTIFVDISALNNIGIDNLLENILLISEINDYKANKKRYAAGTVIESRTDKKIGSVATLLIGSGTLRVGDPLVVGTVYGKVRTMKNDLDEEIVTAEPGMPVSITGLNGICSAGDKFMAFESDKVAKKICEERISNLNTPVVNKKSNLDDMFDKINGGVKEFNIIIKSDVKGSEEALRNSLDKVVVEGARVNIVRSSVGDITPSDIILASASDALIIGFNIKQDALIEEQAKQQNVEIRYYSIIYKVLESVENGMKGLLDPVFEEKILGRLEVRQLFSFSKVGVIAGSHVTSGVIKNNAKARLFRNEKELYNGNIASVQREKNQVKEVKEGFDCGITLVDFDDIKELDIVECYEMVEKKLI